MLTAKLMRENRLKREWNISNMQRIEEERKQKIAREFVADASSISIRNHNAANWKSLSFRVLHLHPYKVARRLLGNHGPKIQSVFTFIDDMYEN